MKIAVFYASDTQAGIVEGFKVLGHSVVPIYYGLKLLSLPERIINKIAGKSWENLARLFNKKIYELDSSLKDINPDLVVFIKGQYLDERSKSILGRWKGVYKIQWTIDSLSRFPGQATLLPFMNSVFFQDGSDVTNHTNGRWLPLGFDDRIFSYRSEKNIDLLLLGNLDKAFYKRRRDFFKKASELGRSGIKICFAGYNADPELVTIFKKNGVKILGKLPLSVYADTISRSKVCLNVNQDDGGKAVNPLFFAIPATGSFQVTDDSGYLSEWLSPGINYFPSDIGNLNETILKLIKGSSACLFRKLSENVRNKHSYTGCAKTIVEAATA